jgi:hypothetical protein
MENENKINPKCGTIYTFRQIITQLYLRDAASLSFKIDGQWECVNDSHCGEQAVLAIPGWAGSRWIYRYETEEWVPVFEFADDNVIKMEQLVDCEPCIDPFAEKQSKWLTPKGFPREQNYSIRESDGKIVSVSGEEYDALVFDEKGFSHFYHERRANAGICEYCKEQTSKRFKYKDHEEGSSAPLHDLCGPCKDKALAQDRQTLADMDEDDY